MERFRPPKGRESNKQPGLLGRIHDGTAGLSPVGRDFARERGEGR